MDWMRALTFASGRTRAFRWPTEPGTATLRTRRCSGEDGEGLLVRNESDRTAIDRAETLRSDRNGLGDIAAALDAEKQEPRGHTRRC